MVLFVLGVRPNVKEANYAWPFLLEISTLILIAIYSVRAAFNLGIPGSEFSKPWKVPMFGIVLWLTILTLLASYSIFIDRVDPLSQIQGYSCALWIISLTAVPVGVLYFATRNYFPTRKEELNKMIFLAGAAFSVLGIELHCIWDTPVHHLIFHFLPAVGILYGSQLIFKRFTIAAKEWNASSSKNWAFLLGAIFACFVAHPATASYLLLISMLFPYNTWPSLMAR